MKRLLAIAATLGFLSSAHANLYTGTFSITITEVIYRGPETPATDLELSAAPVGTVFGGEYSYISDSMDGSFNSMDPNWYDPIPGENRTLQGELHLPSPLDDYMEGVNTPVRFTLGPFFATLTVTDGMVTSFHYSESGRFDIEFHTTTYGMMDTVNGSRFRGTVEWSPPVTVPDSGNSLSLLAISLAGLAVIRRRFAR